ncbi:Putative protein virB11, putative Type II/IV secretion system protein [Escherichia coli]|uniref:Uncharacterized protein n=1 Tax=Escherichia coli TaxID=562 RepID=A0A377BE23_ECOLX|nr:Putative protein virB11, putative Type II/IV secretion system protein [Escherichia coli]
MNPECQNLPFNVILRRVLSNIDIIMSIKYLDDEDFRFASGIYYKQLHFDDIQKTEGVIMSLKTPR